MDAEASGVESPTELAVPKGARHQEVDQAPDDILDDTVVPDDPVIPEDDFDKRRDIVTSETDTHVEETLPKEETIKAKADALKGLKVLGKINLPAEKEKTYRFLG